MDSLDLTIQNLNQRGFHAARFASIEEANKAVLDVIGTGSVGIGGTRTVADMGLFDAIHAHGNRLLCHTFADPNEKQDVRKLALNADCYLSGTNAITEDGRIVNIDGTGNRVAAMLFGPEKVIIVAGKNKVVKDFNEAIRRTKEDCCPKNARRLGKKTPCALTGKCMDCRPPERMCNVTVTLEYPTRNVKSFYVFLVEQELGW